MRDPARIPKVLAELNRLWSTYPDLRLGQLVVNLSGGADTFNIEDDDILVSIRDAQKGRWGRGDH